ncbi:hypothetical protein E0L36_07705 [Streptomyces sp. AJS327]|uniref:hypothetical protein n=1 Tax=Streptomyces sp. AJS327 TaxID=2545265 RepID=UPI0015DE2168|nr:hypothetical protein [Streptomyces sp. AJS327]MBA0050779.1 hypothetical protein [Streptomyces sp. AJS327]
MPDTEVGDAEGAPESDAVHWRRLIPDGNSAAAHRARQKLAGAARDMVRAGALAAYAGGGFHGARNEERVAALLESVTFVETTDQARGGRRLTALAPAGPPGRRVAAALHRALRATREAVTHYQRTASMDGFGSAAEHGASQELTEALCQLLRGTEGARVSVAWSRAAGPPEGTVTRPPAVPFGPADVVALGRAGRWYVDREPSVAVRLVGSVVRLRRAEPDGAGAVRMRVLAGAEVSQVRARLPATDYRTAVHAHLAGLPLSVAGTLESRGGFRRLTGAREVRPVLAGDEARERLVTTLREGLADFEGLVGASGASGAAARRPPR